MIEKLDIFNASSLLYGWARIKLYNEEFLDKVAEEIIKKHKEGIFFSEKEIAEVVNILYFHKFQIYSSYRAALSDLHYINKEFYAILHDQIV